jgi:serine/threonine-protein kinase
VIFNLPNGLQGYFQSDANGNRLDSASTKIVTDKFAADQAVRSGLSCIRCHDAGVKGLVDAVRSAVTALPDTPGFNKARVLELYAEQAELDAALKEDMERFKKSLLAALERQPVEEPLIRVSQRFLDAPLLLSDVAAELGWPDPATLRPILQSPAFTRLGLAAVGSDGVVRRDTWEQSYDQVLRRVGLGVPVVPIDGLTRMEFHSDQSAIDVELETDKPNNVFAPGESTTIIVTNRSKVAILIELIGTSTRGKQALLTPHPTRVGPGSAYQYPPGGARIQIRAEIGKEQITVFASEPGAPAGVLLRGQDVSDRFVHPYYSLQADGSRGRSSVDPTRVVKKTITIETK